jgi:hypothetical protein
MSAVYRHHQTENVCLVADKIEDIYVKLSAYIDGTHGDPLQLPYKGRILVFWNGCYSASVCLGWRNEFII